MVKYDPVLGAFRTIDGGSQNGNTDTIFAGSGLLTRINETGFQTTWSPDFSVNTNLSDVLFSVMYRFDGDEFANTVAHLDFVRRLDALENGDSGGAANFTVNGISPDPEGNINIYAEQLFLRKAEDEYDYPPTIYDGLYTADYYKMGTPIYQSYAVLDCESNTDYYTESTGYILLELGVRDGEVPSVPFIVTINEITVAAIIPAAGTRQTFMFPCPTGASWRCDTPGLPFELVSIQFIPGEHSMY